MNTKITVLLERMRTRLHAERQRVCASLWQPDEQFGGNDEADDTDDTRQQALDAAIDAAELTSDQNPLRIKLVQAEAVLDVLRQRAHQDAPFNAVETLAMEHLAAILGCDAVLRHRATVTCKVVSSTLTYQGSLAAFKPGLRFGLRLPTSIYPTLEASKLAFPERDFDVLDSSDSLSTCRLTAVMTFDLELVSSAGDVDFREIAEECWALMRHAAQPVPEQVMTPQTIEVTNVRVD